MLKFVQIILNFLQLFLLIQIDGNKLKLQRSCYVRVAMEPDGDELNVPVSLWLNVYYLG